MLWQVVEDDVLDQIPVCQVREAAHQDAHGAYNYVRDNRLLEHTSRLFLLGIDVKNAYVALENAEHLTHEHRQHRKVEILIVESLGHFILACSNNFTRLI